MLHQIAKAIRIGTRAGGRGKGEVAEARVVSTKSMKCALTQDSSVCSAFAKSPGVQFQDYVVRERRQYES